MSTITHDNAAAFTGTAYGATPSLSQRFARWRQNRRTIARVTRELNTYTERQISDLGLSRSDIADVARGRITR